MKNNFGHISIITSIVGQYWFAPTKEDNALFRVFEC